MQNPNSILTRIEMNAEVSTEKGGQQVISPQKDTNEAKEHLFKVTKTTFLCPFPECSIDEAVRLTLSEVRGLVL